jgi:hypothetical protein
VGEELSIPQHSIVPHNTIILTPFSSIAFPLEHVIHPAAAAGEDGDGPSTTVSANNGLWRQRQWEEAAVDEHAKLKTNRGDAQNITRDPQNITFSQPRIFGFLFWDAEKS